MQQNLFNMLVLQNRIVEHYLYQRIKLFNFVIKIIKFIQSVNYITFRSNFIKADIDFTNIFVATKNQL